MSLHSERNDPTMSTRHERSRLIRGAVALLASTLVTSACTAETTTVEATTPEPAIDQAVDQAPSGDSGVRVAREIDGDSLEFEIDGEVIEVRLVGINAPEFADCQGPASRDALGALLRSGNIEVAGSESDRFGRLLVELWVDGASVNESMVRAGWALAVHGDGDAYVAAMRAAADDQVGIWSPSVSGCDSVTADVVVVDAEPDPPGRDEENLDEEFVVIANAGTEPLELGGWQVRDESTGNRFVFDDRRLGPGDELVLVTGCGQDSDREVFWCSEFPVWSNHGDTALVLAPDGAVAAHRFVG